MTIPNIDTESAVTWGGVFGNFCQTLISKASEQPLIASATLGIMALGALFAFRNRNSRPAAPSAQTLLRECEKVKKHPKVVQGKVDIFVDELWKSHRIGSVFDNPKNRAFLKEKLANIILESQAPLDVKIEIFQNVIRNHLKSLSEVEGCLRKDLRENAEFRNAFGIPRNDVPVEITNFGGETHNRGKNVFYIRLASGRELVYKPRSTKTEALICGKGGYFDSLGLPSYTVVDIHDAAGDGHGYCEFIKNDRANNVFESTSELVKYLRETALMEQASQAIHLTDLHTLNIIVKDKRPYVIDPEVVLSPTFDDDFRTGLITGQSGVTEFCDSSKNRVYFAESLKQKLPFDLSSDLGNRIPVGALKKWGIDYNQILQKGAEDWAQASSQTAGKVQTLISSLGDDRLRVVPLDTLTLKYLLLMDINEGRQAFLVGLKETLDKGGFVITDERAIMDGFTQDVMNDDFPILYHQPSTGQIFYQGRVIAEARSH